MYDLRKILTVGLLLTMGGVLGACTVSVAQPDDVDARVNAAVAATLTIVATGDTDAEKQAAPATIPDVPTEPADAVAMASPTAPMLITPTPDRSAEIMQYIVENTRHIQGDSAAPVTIIEFSDFQ